MTTLALVAFTLADGLSDAGGWSAFRRWGWPNPRYQFVRFVALRLPMLYAVYAVAGLLTVLLCLVMIWAAPMDTAYHYGLDLLVRLGLIERDDGPLLDGERHDHKGPILPRLAAYLVGDDVQDESEYRTASVAAGLAVLACALCVDLASAIDLPALIGGAP